ncbi:MAG: response regulator [Campylobacterota bacterium]|nr:response regulator [Campylobacterota bacterium]
MLNKNSKNNFQILIIDDDKEYNDRLLNNLKKLEYSCVQAFNLEDGKSQVSNHGQNLGLVILNIDIKDIEPEQYIKFIEDNTEAKIINISFHDNNDKREKFFKYGILDYHLKSTPIEHIVDDIDESIQRLFTNKNETVLVIDDSKVVCFVIKNILEVKNYNVVTALNAKDGIEIIKNQDITLLILDMELPDMHGLELLGYLRTENMLRDFPVLVLSASDNPSDVRNALKNGSSDYLRKPFMFEEFLLKIDLWVKSSRTQKTINDQNKQIEQNLQSFQYLVNATMEALFIFEKNICTEVNDEALKLIGIQNKEELIGKEIFNIFPDVSTEHQKELLDDTVDHFFEDILINSEGKNLQVQIKEKNTNIKDKDLKIIAVMDITSIKQKEKILSHQTKMASMGEMIGNIAHQWRQPLTAISVAAGGIKLNYELDMADTEETIQELDNIVENTQFLSSTIEDFQNFLKDNRATTMFTLKDTLEKTLGIIKANLASSDIHVIKNINKNVQINSIQNDLVQVLLNIINNAGDALKQKKDILDKYIIIDIDGDDEFAKIIIQDSAGGIPAHVINKIFEPYFTTKHQSKGTGLGLYMTHQIVVDNMNGKINVNNTDFSYEDKQLHGARFEVLIPLS